VDPKKLPKLERLKEILSEEVPGKVVIPYHYSESGDLMLSELAAYNPAVIRSAEWMKSNGRDADSEKARFNGSKECRVILLQISAGKYGHDLSGVGGDRCATMVFYENTYSLDDRGQIEMRNTAAFQDWTNVYLDFVSSPVEMQAIKAHIQKEDMVTAVFGAYQENKQRIYR